MARLTADLGTLDQATYLGGGLTDAVTALAIDGSGNAVVAGQTGSSDFPGTTGGAQPSFGGGADAFVARLTPDLRLVRPVVEVPAVGGFGLLALAGLLAAAGALVARRITG